MRKIFIKELTRLNKIKKNIYLVINDLGYNVVEPFRDNYPKHFLNAGVSEQNMMGMSAGIASEQCHTFVYSIANFSTFRCAEQIRNDIDYHNLPVTIVSVGSGLGYGNLGYSHHAIQDYALLRSFPNTVIASPSNNQEVDGSLDYLLKNPQPSYLRLDKSLELNSNKKISNMFPGKWIYYKNKVTNKNLILSTGAVFENCKKLYKNRKEYNWATLPLWGMKYKNQQAKKIKKYKKIITVENHLQDGGFGSWLTESLTHNDNNIKTKIISKFLDKKVIGKVGNEKYLNSKYGPK